MYREFQNYTQSLIRHSFYIIKNHSLQLLKKVLLFVVRVKQNDCSTPVYNNKKRKKERKAQKAKQLCASRMFWLQECNRGAKSSCPRLFLQLRLQNQRTVRRLEAVARVRTSAPGIVLTTPLLRRCRCPTVRAKTNGKTRLRRT